MVEESEHDENIAQNIHEMQETSSVWFQELLQILEGRGSSDDEDDQVQYSQSEMEGKDSKIEALTQHLIDPAQSIVRRLLHSQLASAFDSYAYRVSEVRRQRETCRRVVLKMQHLALTGAFDMFLGTVGQLKAHREIVEKVIARWRAPLLMLVFVARVFTAADPKAVSTRCSHDSSCCACACSASSSSCTRALPVLRLILYSCSIPDILNLH